MVLFLALGSCPEDPSTPVKRGSSKAIIRAITTWMTTDEDNHSGINACIYEPTV